MKHWCGELIDREILEQMPAVTHQEDCLELNFEQTKKLVKEILMGQKN